MWQYCALSVCQSYLSSYGLVFSDRGRRFRRPCTGGGSGADRSGLPAESDACLRKADVSVKSPAGSPSTSAIRRSNARSRGVRSRGWVRVPPQDRQFVASNSTVSRGRVIDGVLLRIRFGPPETPTGLGRHGVRRLSMGTTLTRVGIPDTLLVLCTCSGRIAPQPTHTRTQTTQRRFHGPLRS